MERKPDNERADAVDDEDDEDDEWTPEDQHAFEEKRRLAHEEAKAGDIAVYYEGDRQNGLVLNWRSPHEEETKRDILCVADYGYDPRDAHIVVHRDVPWCVAIANPDGSTDEPCWELLFWRAR
jgi:hypothetical protein